MWLWACAWREGEEEVEDHAFLDTAMGGVGRAGSGAKRVRSSAKNERGRLGDVNNGRVVAWVGRAPPPAARDGDSRAGMLGTQHESLAESTSNTVGHTCILEPRTSVGY